MDGGTSRQELHLQGNLPPPTAGPTGTRGSHMGRGEPRPRHKPVQDHFKPSSRATSGHWELAPGKMEAGVLTPTKGSQLTESRTHLSPKTRKHRGSQDETQREQHLPPSAHRGAPAPHHPAPCLPRGSSGPGPLGRSWE